MSTAGEPPPPDAVLELDPALDPALDPELDALRAAASAAGGPPMTDLTPEQARARVTAGHRLCAEGPGEPDVVVSELAGPVPIRAYRPGPENPEPVGTLVYAHGGGWVTGDLDYSDEWCRHLAAAGLVVLSVAYRLAPEHPYPAALDDLTAAWSWVRGEGAAVCGVRGPLGLGGDSAGGNLAAALTHRAARTTGSGPAFQVLLYPVLGRPGATASYDERAEAFPVGRHDLEWFWAHYAPADRTGAAHADPDLVPLLDPDPGAVPPSYVVVAGHDPLHDEGIAYAERVRRAGGRVSLRDHPSLCHGFLRFTGASATARAARDRAVEDVVGLVRSVASPTERAIHDYDSAQ